MNKKSLEISLVNEDKSDLTFFDIDEKESNETLKLLKQSYVTTNYKDETILNLQESLKNNKSEDNTSKQIKVESYKKYNQALDLVDKRYITTAINLIEEAIQLNPKDTDILNLRGLLSLLKCDFTKAFESFYTSMCYGNEDISRKYIDILSSDEFNVFLARYNHSIRFINEDLNQESIHILDNIIEENSDLIEPHVILVLLYEKLGNVKKKEHYLQKLTQVDKANELIESKEQPENKEQNTDSNKKSKNKNMIVYSIATVAVIGSMVYAFYNKSKMEDLNIVLEEKNEKLEQIDEELSSKEEIIKEANDKLDETNKELENIKKQEKEIEIFNEVDIFKKAKNLKEQKDYKTAIKYFKQVADNGTIKKYKSDSVYQVAMLSEIIDNYDDAKKYYRKYINAYKDGIYYDDAFYQLGLLYYENGELQNAKDIFYELRKEVPNSIYNNSKVKEILSQ